MSFFRSRRGAAAIAVVVIVAMFLVRPGADQLRSRIVRAISVALGRPVEISSVTIQLLPRPAFDLQNFVIHEDPAFGAEPTLQASSATAALRLTSLLRGRLEISRLSLTEPSLNLVRNAAGHWNLENVLARADQTHVAPTSKSKTEVRAAFPYIEASLARINFKFGAEKKPYTLTEADFSVWQDSEDTWGMRLKARPVRTDFNLSDTGTVRMQGSWQRAASLRDTPLRFLLQWDNSQLGQATTLVYGRDQGWRGEVAISTSLTGTAADLAIQGSAAVDDFRRYDLDGGSPLRLAAACDAHYAPLEQKLSGLSCYAPIAGGFMTLTGDIGGYGSSRRYRLNFSVQNVPMQSVVGFARHTKKNIPEDLTATGVIDAAFQFDRENHAGKPQITWTGEGETRNFGLSSAQTATNLFLNKVPFSVSTGVNGDEHNGLRRPQPMFAQIASEPHLAVGPFKLPMGKSASLVASAWSSRSDYALSVQGEAEIRHLLQLARSIGLPAAQPNADGIAKVDLQVGGAWSAFSPAVTLGDAQLRAVRAEVRGLNQPLEIASASLALTPTQVEVTNLNASLAGSAWHGSLTLPRGCVPQAQCLIRFNLHADTIATDEWSELLGSHSRNSPWYRMFASNPQLGIAFPLLLHASGQLTAARVLIHKLAASQVSANVELQNGVLRLSELSADVLGGRHMGDWKADFAANPPAYSGSGTFQDVDLGKLSEMTHDTWITGTGTGSYHVTAAGLTVSELIDSADASLQVKELEGALPHLVLDTDTGPLQLRSFTGRVLLQKGKLQIADANLEAPEGAYQLSGTASLSGDLNLKLMRPRSGGFSIVGPLADPSIAPATAAEARAALKP